MELSGNIRFADESSWLTLTTDSDDAATIKIALSYADEGREETEFSVTPSAGMARFPVGEILRAMINGYHKGITCVVTATQGANSCSTGTNRVFPCRTFALANAKAGIFSDKPKSVKAFGGAPDKITVFCDNNATITVYAKAIQKDGTESASFILDSTSSHNGFYAIDVSLDAVTAKMASEGINADFVAYKVWMTGTLGTSDTYLFEVSPSRLSRKTYKFLGRKGTYEYVHATGEFRRSIEAETQSFVNSGIERELANDSTLTFEQNAGHVDSAEMGAYWLELLASKERYFIGNDGSEHLIIVDDFDTSLTDGIVSSLTFKWHYANPYNVVIEKSDVAITGLAVTGTSSVNNDSNSAQFNVIYLPSNTTQRGVTWSIVGGQQYASIDAGTGLLTVKSGASGNTVKVRATSKANTSIYAEKSVSVNYYAATVAVTGVSLSKTSLSLAEGGSQTLLATVSPTNATNKAVTWSSSNDSVATVDASGKVTAVKAGTATITVRTTDGGKTATCNLTVTAVSVTGVSLSKTSLSLAEGGSQTLLATVSPANATNKAVTWSSSNDSVATVDASGKVTAVKAGTATITVRTVDGGKTANCNLTVTTVAVTNISVNNGVPISLNKGDVKTTTVEVYPVNATDKSITWSSDDESVASVSQSGVISAVASGSTVIRATASNGVQGTVPVNVAEQAVHVTGVTLSPAEINAETIEPYSLVPGGEFSVKAIISPANATNTGRTWVVGAVESYNEDGSVNFVENPVGFSWREELDGNIVIITTKEFGEQAIPEVYVKVTTDDGKFTEDKSYVVGIDAQQSVSSVVLDKNYLSLVVGQPEILAETVFPSSAITKQVTWSSSNDSVATVDASGKVIAVKAGTATITVRTVDGGKTASCSVNVTAATVAVTGVSLDKTSLSLSEGDIEALSETVSPSNATNKAVTWSSSNDSVATVDQGGNVTAVKAGTTTITVRSVDGGKTASCAVNVTAAVHVLDYIETDGKCRIALSNVKPVLDMVAVSSFYLASDPGAANVFYGTENTYILMFVNKSNSERRIASYGYMSGGKRNISYEKSRPSEPTNYLLKQIFSGSQNYTAYYSNSGSPYLHSSLDDYQVSNPNTRYHYGYTDNATFPDDQNLSVFGVSGWGENSYMVAGSRFYGMQIWSGGLLVHDLVPAKLGDDYGIYDAVTGDFYGNSDSGTITGGDA